MLLEAFVII